MPRTVLILLGLCLLAAPAVSAAEGDALGDARTLFLKGEYDKAATALGEILKAEPANEQAAALLGELHIELGRFAEAVKRCDGFLRSTPKSLAVRSVLAEALYERGELDKAYAETRKVEALDPANLRARFLEGLIQYDRGERVLARQVFETFIDAWQNTPEDKLSAEDVTTIGQACAYFAIADANAKMLNTIVNNIYPLALRKDPLYTPALIASGTLLLEKYNVPQAHRDFESVLRINPNHPLALVGAVRCEIESRRFVEAAELADRAMKAAPDSPAVLLLEAMLSVFDEDFDAALATTEKVLAINPSHQEALGLKGACLRQLGRTDDYAKTEEKALAANRKCSVFYASVADVLIMRHADGEAEPLLAKALDLTPGDSTLSATLGLLYMRQGKEKEAYGILDGAFKRDSFNVLVYNTLNLLDKMKEFETKKTEHFTLRAHPKVDKVLLECAADYLERIYPEVTGRFKFPVPHTLIEFFPDHTMFSVRTTGVPNIGTVGACLGPIIAMDSPAVSPGAFNWAQVLRHEYTHVVTLAATDMHIAHWFTEALAVNEERLPKEYEWYQLLVDSIARDEIMPVTKLNNGFTRARTQRRRTLAYAQAEFTAEFIDAKWGRDRINSMLEHYRKNESTEQVIEAVFGMKPAQFDAAFLAWLKETAAAWKLKPVPRPRDEAEVDRKLAQTPNDATLHADLARIKLAKGDLTGAALSARRALELDANLASAHALLGTVRLRQKNVDEAKTELEAALKLDANEVTALEGMVAVSQAKKDKDRTLECLRKLRELEPRNPRLPAAIARLLLEKKDEAGALENFTAAAELGTHDYASTREAVRMLVEKKDYASAEKFIDEAIHILPYDRALHQWAQTAYEATGDKARAELEKKIIPLTKEAAKPVTPPPPPTPPPADTKPVEP
jgi:tetratricopeptide (TPR) repeat protein